jgi:hypothetical protein
MKGGDNSEQNLVACCRQCNAKKREFTIEQAGMKYVEGYIPPKGSSKPLASTDTDTDTDTEKEKKVKKNISGFVLPEWIPKEAWSGFVEMRKEIKKALTGRAVTLAINRLEELKAKGHDPGKVLDQSTYSKWQGLFEIKQEITNVGNIQGRVQQGNGTNEGTPPAPYREYKDVPHVRAPIPAEIKALIGKIG